MSKNRNVPGWTPKHKYLKSVKGEHTDKKLSLNPTEVDRLILQQGIPVKVYRSMFCPNTKSIDAAEHQIDCSICNGSGIIDVNPIDTWAFLDSNTMYNKDLPEGRIDGNVVHITFLSGIDLQYFTLIELDIPDTFYEKIKRQEGNLDLLKYKALQINAVVDSSGKQYYEGNDFVLDPNGSVAWISGRGPSKNVIYSIHYHSKIQFRTTRAVFKNRFIQNKITSDQVEIIKVNETWEASKEYLIKRKDILNKFLDKNDIEDK